MSATFAPLTRPSSAGTGRPAAHWLQVMSHTDARYGGLSSAVPALAASIAAQAQIRSELAAFCAPGEAAQPAALAPEEVSFWPTSRRAWLLDRELKARFRKRVAGVEGLHIHGLWEQSTAVACQAARRLGKPYVLSAHGMLEPWALAAKRRKKQIYAALVERGNIQGAACLHALTATEAAQYRAFGARGPIAVVPNAVEVPSRITAEPFLQGFPALRNKRLVLFLARLHPKKGLDLLIEAWARVAPQHPDAHLLLAGPDSEGTEARVRQAVFQSGLAGQVTFAGMVHGETKWSAFAAAEGFVLPSYSEGLSMALLEAMGSGVPVIATRPCNMPEIATLGAGWEIDPEAAEVAEALEALLQASPATNRERGLRGARLIAARYRPQVVAQQMAEVYGYALGGPRPAQVSVLDGGER